MVSMLRLTAAVAALSLWSPRLGGAQTLQPLYIAPSAPLSPTDMKQCQALNDAWAEIRKSVDAQHSSCLDQQSKSGARSEAGASCSFAACQPYHGAYSLGSKDVDLCRERVYAYREEERKRQREAERLAEEQRRRDEAARQAAEARRRDAERQERDRQRQAAEQQAAARERAREQERRRTAEDKAMRAAQDADRAQRQALDAANQLRDQQAEQARADRERADQKLGDKLSQARDKITGAAQSVAEAAKGLAATGSTAGPPQSNFDIAAADGSETAAQALSTRLQGYINLATTAGGAMVPWGGVNFSLINNASQATSELIDQVAKSMDQFEQGDGGELGRALDSFPERVFGPRALLRAVAENAGAAYLATASRSLVLDAAAERAAIQWRSAIDQRDPRALFRLEANSAPARPAARVFHWWENAPSSRAEDVLRDSRGTPLLFDKNGKLVLYDEVQHRALYDVADLERIVARSDALPHSVAVGEWRQNAVAFLPSALSGESAARELVTGWVIGGLSATAVSEALKRAESALRRKP